MRSALIKLREGRGEVFNHLAEDFLQPEKENREEEEGNSLLQLLDPLSNKLKRGSCFEIPQPKRKRSLPCEEDLLLEEKLKRNKRCPSEESNNSIDAELNRHFRPIKRAPLSPPKVSFFLCLSITNVANIEFLMIVVFVEKPRWQNGEAHNCETSTTRAASQGTVQPNVKKWQNSGLEQITKCGNSVWEGGRPWR